MRMPRKCGRGLWFGEQFFDPLSGGVGVQNLLKLGLMRSKRALGVLTVETIGRIRRGHFLKGSSKKVRIRYPGWYGDSRFGGPIVGARVERSSAWALVSFSRSLFLGVRACPGAAHC